MMQMNARLRSFASHGRPLELQLPSPLGEARSHCPTRSGLTRRCVEVYGLQVKHSPPSVSPAHSTSQTGYIENVFTGAAPENY